MERQVPSASSLWSRAATARSAAGTRGTTNRSTSTTSARVSGLLRLILFAVSAAICERVPGATVLRNQIPKSYLPYDLYCNLIPNKDQPDRPVFDQVPRTGAFEVSYKGMVSPRILPLTHFLFIIVDLLQAPGCLLAQCGTGRATCRPDCRCRL